MSVQTRQGDCEANECLSHSPPASNLLPELPKARLQPMRKGSEPVDESHRLPPCLPRCSGASLPGPHGLAAPYSRQMEGRRGWAVEKVSESSSGTPTRYLEVRKRF